MIVPAGMFAPTDPPFPQIALPTPAFVQPTSPSAVPYIKVVPAPVKNTP